MQIDSQRMGDLGVITLKGRLDGESAPHFDGIWQEAVHSGCKRFIVDVSAMDYVSSLGLRSFISIAKAVDPKGGKVLLVGLSGLPKQVFQIAHLFPIFPMYATMEDALATFNTAESRWLTLTASPASLPAFSKFVHEGATAARIPEIDQPKLDLILEELLQNVSLYAYPDRVGGVEVGYTVVAPGRLRIEICDTGVPFNPLEVPEPALSENVKERGEGGLGLLLVKNFVHDLKYERDPYRNILRFELRAARAAEA